jgi:CubicO group peptidase (beta-lactamase class C family)
MASRLSLHSYAWRALIALFLVLTAHPAWAASMAQPAEPEALAEVLDPIFAQQMAEHHIPGAAFVMVKDGQVVLAKGYGSANLAQQTPGKRE